MKQNMNQVLVINKEKEMTSRDVVNEVCKIFHMKKVGHTGTLDPIATGVLIICMGKYTKLVEELTSYQKEYVAEVILGLDTDTLDTTGTILKEEKAVFSKREIEKVLNNFPSSYEQEVPIYSAVKMNGKKLYEYAREGIEITLPKRTVQIFSLSLVDDVVIKEDKTIFKIRCSVSKGTYIRSLIKDIAKALNTVGVMKELIRTKQGDFTLTEAYTLDEVKEGKFSFASQDKIFSHYEKVTLNEEEFIKVQNGMKLKRNIDGQKVFFVDKNNNPIAIYQVDEKDDTRIKPYKMFL